MTRDEIKHRIAEIIALPEEVFDVVYLYEAKRLVIVSGQEKALSFDQVEDLGEFSRAILEDSGWLIDETFLGIKEVIDGQL